MAEQVIQCSSACTVTVRHELSIAGLNIDIPTAFQLGWANQTPDKGVNVGRVLTDQVEVKTTCTVLSKHVDVQAHTLRIYAEHPL